MTHVIFKNITIIGTSHIAKESVDTVAKYIEEHKPQIIAVELDKDRMISLMTKEYEEIKDGKKDDEKRVKKKKKESMNISLLFKVGPFGYLFYLMGHYAQKKLGSIVNLEPGADMKSALECARKNNINIALIDQ
jgi:pheromone shutdown protein TraB